MKDNFEHILNQQLGQLPEFHPEENSWDKIKVGLAWEDKLSEKISELPLADGLDVKWDNIAGSIKSQPTRTISIKWIAIAASITLLLAIGGNSLITNAGIEIEKEFATVYETQEESIDPIFSIKDLCQSGAPVCSSSAFEEKLALYEEVSEELDELNEVINAMGESPDMVRSIIKMENLRSSTIQELIQMIHS